MPLCEHCLIYLLIIGVALSLIFSNRLLKRLPKFKKHPWILWFNNALGLILLLWGIQRITTGYEVDTAAQFSTAVQALLHSAWYMVFAWILIGFVDTRFWKTPQLTKKNNRVPPRALFHIFNVLVACVTGLIISDKVFDLHIPSELIISSGILAALLGFSAKDILSDMMAGLIISIDRPFRRGDWIELDDGKTLGEVSDISWRVTKIVTWFNTIKEIPNSSVIRQTVNNLSAPNPSYGHWFYIYMPSDVSVSLTRRTLLQACLDCDDVLEDPAPVVRISEMEHRPYKYMIYVHFVDYPSYFKAKDRLLSHINNALAEEKIPVPAKTRDVDIYQLTHERVPIVEYSNKELIRKVQIFDLLDDEHCDILLREMQVLDFDAGETILDAGESNDALYILAFGKIKVKRTFPDGSEHTIEKIYPGGYFGVMSLLASEPSPDKYVAMGECRVLEFKQSTLETIFKEHPEMMKEMANFLAKQKFRRMAKLNDLVPSNKNQRGERSLRRYAKEFLALLQHSFSDH